MPKDARFWRNVTIIALLHLAILLGLLWWSRTPRRAPNDVVWMEAGAGSSGATGAPPPAAIAAPVETPLATPNEVKEEPTPEILPTARSEIELPATPSPTAIPSATPTPKPTPPPTATPSATPKPTPKPTARSTPKHTPTPKSKASPSPTKKATPKPKPTEATKEENAETAHKKTIAKTALGKDEAGESSEGSPFEKPVKKATAAGESASEAKGKGGSGGHGEGEGGASEFGWYANMLHDRFYSEWVQPTSVVHTAKLSVLLRIRIQKDGRISDYSVAKSSGNPVVDDSVTAAAARVKQVDPLPSGLGGDYYDVNINFELGSGE
jgi:TonB family protein